jgi:hypothetical protein
MRWLILLCFSATFMASVAFASASAPSSRDQLKSARILTEGFLRYHPDIKFRLEGLAKLEAQEPAAALQAFKRAAKYGDKISQAMVAELLWSGAMDQGARADAYAWMDLAAERGYQMFVIQRERYWAALDAAERERAVEVGQAVYAEFGDAVAKPRLEQLLKRGALQITGSRVGFVGTLEIVVPGPGGLPISISGDEFYDAKLWRPERYFEWQDRTWGGAPVGTVTVGDLDSNAESKEQD